jgi:biotin synthase
VFRFIMPSQTIRCAAGRKSLGKNGEDVFRCGANALISGDFLTTPGSTNEEDIAMLERLGYECGK